MKRKILLDTICHLFVLLFVYTALSKLFLFHIYLYDLGRSPWIGKYANVLSILVPGLELGISVSLLHSVLYNKPVTKGLYGALILMVAFTIYVAGILTLTTSRPCTCGGIIRELTWPQHLVFNIVFTILAAIGIALQRSILDNPKAKPPSKCPIIAI